MSRRRQRARQRAQGQTRQAAFGDTGNRKEWIAGALAVGFAYAALATTGFGVIDEPVKTMVDNFQWQHLPLHGLFSVAAATVGATGMMIVDRLSSRGGFAPGR